MTGDPVNAPQDGPETEAAPAEPRVPGYRVEGQLGRGGMAVVYRAVDVRLGRTVALKVLAPALAGDDAFRQRFVRESRAAAAVDHPHILPIYETGEVSGVLYIAMRYVPGGDVHQAVGRTRLTPARAASIISATASALDAAHAAGLVHRDVKPANMLLDASPGHPDHVYLSDFGLSKSWTGSTALSGSGMFLGTPNYSAPEQIDGKPVDGRTDQYALACTAFELLAGQPPFQREDAATVIWAHMSAPPPVLTELQPELPAEVDHVFARALAKAPADRYPTCADFGDALRAALGLARYHTGAAPIPASGSADHAATEVAALASADGPTQATSAGAAAAKGGAGVALPADDATLTVTPHQEVAPGLADDASRHRPAKWLVLAGGAALVCVAAAAIFLGTRGPVARSPRHTGTTPRLAEPSQITALDDAWVSQLASVPVSAGIAERQKILTRVRQDIPAAMYLDSSQYASLRPGYWVIYYQGSFSNGSEALAFCAAHGRDTSHECVGRFISHQKSDIVYICLPSGGSPTGRCTHPAVGTGPAAASSPPAAASQPTQVIAYAPWTGTGQLASGISVTATVSGSCWVASGASQRTDAFRCMTGNYIHDPCFADYNAGTVRDLSPVACPDPGPDSVLVMHLTKPLPTAWSGSALPGAWLLVLSNGQECSVNTGMGNEVGGMDLTYYCQGGAVYGQLVTTSSTWKAFYLPTGSTSSALVQVPISRAYQ